ncbi:hypothetical protein HDU93_007078 [Gonapodya sp. JEL0774]|nr:hypothetical protein HDU93_007078 [Gonapodya sp. JEL0774]
MVTKSPPKSPLDNLLQHETPNAQQLKASVSQVVVEKSASFFAADDLPQPSPSPPPSSKALVSRILLTDHGAIQTGTPDRKTTKSSPSSKQRTGGLGSGMGLDESLPESGAGFANDLLPENDTLQTSTKLSSKSLSNSNLATMTSVLLTVLKSHSLFKNLSEAFLRNLISEMHIRVHEPNHTVIRKGEVGRAMFFIVRGEIEAVSEDGETILNIVGEGNFIGEIGVLFSVPRTVSCRTRGRCILMSLTKDKLAKVLESHPEASESLRLIAAERFQNYIKQQERKINVAFGEELKLGMTKEDLQKVRNESSLVPLFRDAEVGFLHMLALTLEPSEYSLGSVIFRRGDEGHDMFFLIRGTCEVYGDHPDRSGAEQVYATFTAGSFFGELALLFNMPRTASVRVTSRTCLVFRLSKDSLDGVLSQFPEIRAKIKEEAKIRFAYSQTREEKLVASLKQQETSSRMKSDVSSPITDDGTRFAQAAEVARKRESTSLATEIDVVREKLKSVDLFRNSNVEIGVLHEIALRMKIGVIKAGEPVVRKGDRGSSMFFVVEGLAEVVSEDGFKTFAQMRGGSFFGEVALFYDVPRTATVMVRQECTLLELHKDDLLDVLRKHSALEKTLRQTTDENYRLFLSREKELLARKQPEAEAQNKQREGGALQEGPTSFAEKEKNKGRKISEVEAYGLEATASNLKRIALFAHCSEAFLRQLALATEINLIEPGVIIINKGDPADDMYFIVRGSVEVVTGSAEIGFTVHDTMGRGSYFGEVGVIKKCTRTATLRAGEDGCDTLRLSRTNFQRVIKQYKELYASIALEAESRFRASQKRNSKQEKEREKERERERERKRKKERSDGSKKEKLPKFLGWRNQSDDDTSDSSSDERGSNSSVDEIASTNADEIRPSGGQSSLDSIDIPAEHPTRRKSDNSKPRTAIVRSARSFGVRGGYNKHSKVLGPDLLTNLPASVAGRIVQNLDVISRVRLSLTSRHWAKLLDDYLLWNKIDGGDRLLRHKLNGVSLAALARLGGHGIRRVRLHSCYLLRDGDLDALADLAPNVTKLSISNCWHLTDGAVTIVAQRCVALRELDLSYLGHLTGDCFRDHGMQSLRRLDLSHCKNLQDENIAQALLPGTPDLAEIHLRRCTRLTEQTLYALAKNCLHLRVLDLGDCAFVTDRSLQWVASSCRQLAALSLRFCGGVTNIGLANLASVAPGQWEGLDLSFCTQIDRLESLGTDAASGLRSVFLRGCPLLTPQTALWLARSAPKLERVDLTRCPKIGPEVRGMVASVRVQAATESSGSYTPTTFRSCEVTVDLPPESRGVLTPEQRGVPRATEVPVEEMHTAPVCGRVGFAEMTSGGGGEKRKRKVKRKSLASMD